MKSINIRIWMAETKKKVLSKEEKPLEFHCRNEIKINTNEPMKNRINQEKKIIAKSHITKKAIMKEKKQNKVTKENETTDEINLEKK